MTLIFSKSLLGFLRTWNSRKAQISVINHYAIIVVQIVHEYVSIFFREDWSQNITSVHNINTDYFLICSKNDTFVNLFIILFFWSKRFLDNFQQISINLEVSWAVFKQIILWNFFGYLNSIGKGLSLLVSWERCHLTTRRFKVI